jgi:hypothetical protein
METVTELQPWRVTMRGGAVVTVWSTSWSVVGDDHVFEVIVRADKSEQQSLDVTATTPSDATKVLIAVARFPVSAVSDVTSE